MVSTPFILGLKAVPNFLKLSDEAIEYYGRRLDQPSEAFLQGYTIPAQEKSVDPEDELLVLRVIATMQLDAIPGKKTYQCFTGERWRSRDVEIDSWLSKDQPDTEACMVTALGFSRKWEFVEAVRLLLGAPQTDDIVVLGNWVIENGYALTLPQIEDDDGGLVTRTVRGENTGLTEESGNFCLIKTGDPKNPVSVGCAGCVGRDWHAGIYRLGLDCRWNARRRLLICNFKDALKL